MFNLLITAMPNAWDRNFYEYDRSRMLEYTSDDIIKMFNNNLTELLKLPCLFAYEQFNGKVFLGKMKSLKERGRNVFLEYEIVKELSSDIIADNSLLFDIGDWEINRTHWAVKNENLLERLDQLNLITIDEYSNAFENTRIEITQMSGVSSEKYVMSLVAFIKRVFEIKKEKDVTVFYRGHSKKDGYKLVPSLFRTDEKGNYKYLPNEDLIYREMIIANPDEFSGFSSTLDVLMKMQHYSLPTRLLDITSNPLIALYFACKSNQTSEGEVIILKVKNSQVKYFDSDTVSCISNLARLSNNEKEIINFNESDFNKQLPIERLLHFIKEEKPFFEPLIKPEDLHKVVCVKGKHSNNRIISQSGAFFLFGIDAILDEKGTNSYDIERITIRNKQKIIEELEHLNINESTVFPYIENSAKIIAHKYEIVK